MKVLVNIFETICFAAQGIIYVVDNATGMLVGVY